ncbi:MAG: hypothetical protein AAFY41_17600, partial [Bacteroidota bacterium]
LILFSTAVIRRLILYLFSFLLTFSLCSLYFYWRGDLLVFIDSFLIQSLIMSKEYVLSIQGIGVACGGILLIFVISVFKTWSKARLTNIQQKIQQVFWIMFLGGVATFFLSNEKSLHELVFFVPIVTYFWAHYFLLIKRRFFKMVMPLVMILGLFIYSCFTYQNILSQLEVNVITSVPNQTMILGDGLACYEESKVLTPCFDAHMTTRISQGLNYYGSAGELYTLFEKADPRYIIDEIEIIDDVFERFPSLALSYEQTGPNKYQKISN